MSYSFDKQSDRWSELADGYQSMLDQLNEDESEFDSVFIKVGNFDTDEIL